MSCFDYVLCDWLPKNDPNNFHGQQDGPFQTKDLGCDMDVYEITREGRLLRYTPEYYGELRLVGDQNFHGILHFYDRTEWAAQFLDGSLIAVWRSGVAWTPDYDEWERIQQYTREAKAREALLATMTPDQRAAYIAEQHKKAGEAMAAVLHQTVNRKGFMRRLLERRL
ncbi:hypothetical protein [Ralstonia phage phiRSL1]|uniref:Uncharacterized protein n=1 Tax=Ralstonia phage phiRSL1 TaxID=1980924 RepID=B2ZY93_9CAUD|nr:hypothetical protein RSL1_ORF279 [Ralstonia phage phiRSL1]BAG41726.1 hypothetical protein [Ralstonia phage phiRSL1]